MVDMQLIVPRINIPLFQMKLYSRERLEAAFLILSGIPRENINLRKWRDGRGPNGEPLPLCRTIACGAGWLCMHPDMNELGLAFSESHRWLVSPVYTHRGKKYVGVEALGRFLTSESKERGVFVGAPSYGTMGVILFSPRGASGMDRHLFASQGIVRSLAGLDEESDRDVLSDRQLLLGRIHYAYHHMSE